MPTEERKMEMEIKARAPEGVESRIKELGASFDRAVKQRDIYFNHPCRDFGVTDEALRIRYEDGRAYMTYKGPKIGEKGKVREELEFAVEDGEKAESLLEKSGFVRYGEVSKTRRIYLLDSVSICVDSVEGLGTFVEVEILGENEPEAIGVLEDIRKKLGLRSIRESYLEMLMHQKYISSSDPD